MSSRIKCASCGQFIPNIQFDDGSARIFYEPDSHFGHEIVEWTCARCSQKERTISGVQSLNPQEKA